MATLLASAAPAVSRNRVLRTVAGFADAMIGAADVAISGITDVVIGAADVAVLGAAGVADAVSGDDAVDFHENRRRRKRGKRGERSMLGDEGEEHDDCDEDDEDDEADEAEDLGDFVNDGPSPVDEVRVEVSRRAPIDEADRRAPTDEADRRDPMKIGPAAASAAPAAQNESSPSLVRVALDRTRNAQPRAHALTKCWWALAPA
jgi:hypothetical protein